MLEFAFGVSLEAPGSSPILIALFDSYYGGITIFFWLDLVYNFFTAFYDAEGELEFNHHKIAMNYFKSYFIIDLVSNLPLTGPFGLLKAFRMHRMLRVLTRWSYLGYDPMKLQVFKLVIFIVTIGHMLACTFFMVSRYDFNQTFEESNYEVSQKAPTRHATGCLSNCRLTPSPLSSQLASDDNNTYYVIDASGGAVVVENWIIADAGIDPRMLTDIAEKPGKFHHAPCCSPPSPPSHPSRLPPPSLPSQLLPT